MTSSIAWMGATEEFFFASDRASSYEYPEFFYLLAGRFWNAFESSKMTEEELLGIAYKGTWY